MATLGSTAGEDLSHGKTFLVKVKMGTFTASSLVFDGGLTHADNTTGRRVGTYATPVRTNDLVKVITTEDNANIVVERMAASDNGSKLFGIVESIRGNAGDTLWDCKVYVPGDLDILEFDSGADADAVDIVPGDKVSLDADAYSVLVPHGFTVKKDATNGFGYVLNLITDNGQRVRVLRNPAHG